MLFEVPQQFEQSGQCLMKKVCLGYSFVKDFPLPVKNFNTSVDAPVWYEI